MIKKRIVGHLRALENKKAPNIFENISLQLYSRYRKLKKFIHATEDKKINRIYIRSRKIRQSIKGNKYRFITIEDAIIWTSEWLKSFPVKYDIIVGIPRSGMLIASIIALKLGRPLTTPDLFAKKQFWLSLKVDQYQYDNNPIKVLLVDDSINSGKTLFESIETMRSSGLDFEITKAALIASEETHSLVDTYYKKIKHPRVFEWNMLHRKIASYSGQGKIALDMDGVICENCPPKIDTNEKAYISWIQSARPYLIPSFEIDVIVSCRLEKYRDDTEKWLSDHKVKYKKLMLWDIESKEKRAGRFAKHKIDVLLRVKPDLFWESSLNQAEQIWKTTKLPVLCIDNWIMFN